MTNGLVPSSTKIYTAAIIGSEQISHFFCVDMQPEYLNENNQMSSVLHQCYEADSSDLEQKMTLSCISFKCMVKESTISTGVTSNGEAQHISLC